MKYVVWYHAIKKGNNVYGMCITNCEDPEENVSVFY